MHDEPKKRATEKAATEKRTSVASAAGARAHAARPHKEKIPAEDAPFVRAENEDDDGYDPFSDRRPPTEPLFERDPWD